VREFGMEEEKKRKGWASRSKKEKEEYVKRELAKYEAFSKKAKESLHVSEEDLNRVVKI